MNASERNFQGKLFVLEALRVAKTKSLEDFIEIEREKNIRDVVSDLIEAKAKGFRGIVITALTGMHLDETYNPLTDFYKCSPRSIFEGGIWYALQENNIPCGKSDPLNVAKNAGTLNEDWAKGKRPESAAIAVVVFLKIILKSNKDYRIKLVEYFFFRLFKYAEKIKSFKVSDDVSSSSSRQLLCDKLVRFTLNFPEAGHFPQLLIYQLLREVFKNSSYKIEGGGESVFGTNTTSKKPADIWMENNGTISNLYEVTVKEVNLKRLDDVIDALNSTGFYNLPITFICRIPEDVQNLPIEKYNYVYKGRNFDFVDYEFFCKSMCALLTDEALNSVFDVFKASVESIQISIKTKTGWNEIFL